MKDLVIIGGGPAGMSAAIAAYESGIRDILILERDEELGGILQQCIYHTRNPHKVKLLLYQLKQYQEQHDLLQIVPNQ